MNYSKYLKGITLLSSLCLAFGIFACGGDSSSGSDDPTTKPTSSSDGQDFDEDGNPVESSSSAGDTGNAPADQDAPPPKSSASETVSSDEQLNAVSQKVSGTCAPENPAINKGELATWNFYRTQGGVYDQILAPFVWTFEGANQEKIQGNGMQTVTMRYENSGLYKATLVVDGNKFTCEELQVKGIPITVASCKPNKSTAYTGDPITWTVDASSESEITDYSWASESGAMSGNGVEGSITAPAGIHKEAITAVVTVKNKDNTFEKHTCERVTVLDPNHVDMVLSVGNINDQEKYGETLIPSFPDSAFIQANEPTVVQIPANAKTNCSIGCKPRISADYNSTEIFWDSDDPVSNIAYFSPAGCAPDKKYSVTTNVTAICVVNQ